MPFIKILAHSQDPVQAQLLQQIAAPLRTALDYHPREAGAWHCPIYREGCTAINKMETEKKNENTEKQTL
jgi:hypothetical protein